MPTGSIAIKNWGTTPISVLATDQGLRSPRMVTMDLSYVQPNTEGNRVLLSGSVICRLSSGLGRVYPASWAIAATSTSSNIVKLKNVSIYKAGDVLAINGTTAVGTIASINVATDTITLTANATNAIAVGDILIAQEIGTPLGIVVSSFINLSTDMFGRNDVAAYVAASVYGIRMPYWSSGLQTLFPGIVLV